MFSEQQNGVVDFEDIREIKKKSVRGLLKKRAKQYNSDDSADKDQADSDTSDKKPKQLSEKLKTKDKKKRVQKESFRDAFKKIMEKGKKTSFKEDGDF